MGRNLITKEELEYNLNELFLTYNEVSEKYGINRNTLVYYGKQYSITKLKLWEFLNKNHGEQIISMYANGMSLVDIQNFYNLNSYNPISNVLKANGIKTRNKSESKKMRDKKYINSNGRIYSINHNYFKTLNEESVYWLGFIYTDGNITKTSLKIGLQEGDLSHLEKFSKSIESNKPIYYNSSSNSYNLDVASTVLTSDLRKIGLHENKSKTILFPEIPDEYIRDFIRGVIDGDGSIDMQYPTNKKGIKTKIAQIRVRIYSGSKDFIEALNQKMSACFGVKVKKINKANKTTYEIAYSTKESIKIYKKIYYDGCVCLDRKFKDFTKYTKQREYDLSNRI